MSTIPLNLHRSPAAGFDEPFEMLLACHERVQHMLALLLRLGAHLREHGVDESARQAARDVMRYFDQAGPAHHEDEERHLFPLLLAQGEPDIIAVVRRLQQDHQAMTVQWRTVRADLQTIADGAWQVAQAATTAPRWQTYADLYAGHIAAEEGQAYPAARPLLPAAAQRVMGQEMAQRRGAPPPP
ncbi:MAG: hemerythrin domain-containing protein [Rubrivivax sp.]|nr:hemerythrin domain-containing protein [Rubrivivax sp.]